MYEKITLPSLITLLAEKTGKQKKQCEDFLRELFNTLTESLCAGENVKIKGIGTFKVIDVEPRKSVNVNTGEDIEIPGHRKIVFIPSKEMAEDVNSPFAMFETVEISDTMETEQTDNEVEENEGEENEEEEIIIESPAPIISSPEIKVPEETQIEEKAEESEAEVKSDTSDEAENETPDFKPTDFTVVPVDAAEDAEKDQNISTENEPEESIEEPAILEDEEDYEQPNPKKRSFKFMWGFLAGIICMALIAIIGYLFLADKFNELINTKTESVPVDTVATASLVTVEESVTTPDTTSLDSITPESADNTQSVTNNSESDTPSQEDVAPTQPSDQKVYDTISKTRYLTTMAKVHYGNFNLWPYIYEENKNILGHPDRIRPGTKVVIPPLSKYGVDPNNPADIKRAKQKGVEIYARFNK